MLQNMGDKWTLLLVLITFSVQKKYQMRFRQTFESLSFGKTAVILKVLNQDSRL